MKLPINLNSNIYFKLTPVILNKLLEQKFTLPNPDKDGLYKFQLWEFIEKFHNCLSSSSPFFIVGGNIYIDVVLGD